MKKIIFICTLLVLAATLCKGQDTKPSYFKNGLNNYELGLSSNGEANIIDLGWNHLHPVTKNKKFKIGYGIRFTGNFGKGAFITAPAKLTSGTESPLVIFADDKLENFDTIGVSSFNVNSINASIHLNYAFTNKWEIEFNIDAIGFSFGNSVTADYNSSKRNTSNPMADSKQTAKPSPFNLLLVSDNDIGSLNSEIKIKYYFRNQWALNVGGTFIFAEYTTANKLYKDNDRFRQKTFVPMIGISYSPFKK